MFARSEQLAAREKELLARPNVAALPPQAAVPSESPPVLTEQAAVMTAGSQRISDEKIAALVAAARQLMVADDIPSARLVLQRAAETGNAAAALDLGATYDPNFLHSPKPNMADIGMARHWYARAKALGSTEAAGRLERLRSVPSPRR